MTKKNNEPIKPTEKDMQIHGRASGDIAETVYHKLKEGYKKKFLGWILSCYWFGPVDVRLDMIDSSNRSSWEAIERSDKIRKMAKKMQKGENKPVILVNDPSNDKLLIIDGHTHFLARESIGGKTISAYIAEVGSVDGDWTDMRKLLKEGEKGGKRK